MNIKFQKPVTEAKFQAEIYRANQGKDEVYRVIIGREGTEVPPKVKGFVDYHKISDFLVPFSRELYLVLGGGRW